MGIINFNKTPKHQRFNYIPRYWDEAKEDLQERVRIAQGDPGNAEMAKSRIQAGLRRRYSRQQVGKLAQGAEKARAVRLFVIIGILCLMTYFFLQSDMISKLISTFAG